MANDQVDVVAHPEGQVAQVGPSNPALQLAGALSDVNSDLAPVLSAYGQQQNVKAQAQAHADALKTSGKSFADAVKAGELEPTQSPWYMYAYEQDAAAVRGQAAASDLVTKSQTWAERNDPQAYSARLNQEMGKLGEAYTGVHQQQGFLSAATPTLAQALNQNESYNVQRINQEHTQNIAALSTSAIQQVVQANGGHAPPDKVFASLEPLRQQWLATGGTDAKWNELAVSSVLGAAYQAGDRGTANSILDTLNDSRGGKGALASLVDSSGQPIAENIERSRYYIDRALDERATAGLKGVRSSVALAGEQAVQSAWDHFGAKLLDGSASKDDIQSYLLQQNVPARSVGYALGQLAENQQKLNSLGKAQIELHTNDSDVAQRVLGVFAEARTKGLTHTVYSEAIDMVRSGTIDYNEAKDLLSAAQSRSDHMDAEGRADARQAKSDVRAEKTADRQAQIDAARNSKEYKGQSVDVAVATLEGLGNNALSNSPQGRQALTTRLNAAEGTWLRTHPNDWQGARAAVDEELDRYLKPKIASIKARKAGTSKPTIGGAQ